MKTATLFRRCALLLFILSLGLFQARDLSAQGLRVYQYPTTTFTSPFNDISGTGLGLGLGGNCTSCVTSPGGMPFAFPYDGVTLPLGTALYVYSCGDISFSNQINSTLY